MCLCIKMSRWYYRKLIERRIIMCCENNRNSSSCCLAKTLEAILLLQQKGESCELINDCTRPFLGPSVTSPFPNTRPITLYSCNDNILWTMPYTLNGTTATSSVFRIECLDECCATFRVLAPSTDDATFPYVTTNDFFTINLNCVGALRCLDDTFVSGI